MSVNEDWDVEQHKVEYESDEHWELRRKFLLAHKDKFSEDVLVCLAQVFVNVELLGCRYPQETMDLVKELSQDVAAEFREKQKKKLQRTFVEASEAASSKVKGCAAKTSTVTEGSVSYASSHINTANHISNMANHTDQSCKQCHPKKSKKLNVKKKSFPNVPIESVSNAIGYNYQSCENSDIQERPSKIRKTEEDISFKDQAHSYGDIVLWEKPGEPALNILKTSATVSGVALTWKLSKIEESWECIVYIDTQKLSCCTNVNKKVARKEAATIALDTLQKHCYTIKVKQDLDTMSDVIVTSEEIKSQESISDDEWKGSNCIGKKLMKMMGWTGGGLGKSGQGIVEPMSAMVKTQISREGLGSLKTVKTNSCKANEIKDKCRRLFKDLLQTDNYQRNDIVFLDFSKEDRMLIHQVARTMGLKSRSHGKDQRKLIVSRKINIWNLIRELNNHGGVTEKYELVKPTDEKLISEAARSKVEGCASEASTVTEGFVLDASYHISNTASHISNTANHISNMANHIDQSCKKRHSKKSKKLNVKKKSFPNVPIESVSNAISYNYQPCENPDIQERPSKILKTEEDISFKDQAHSYGDIVLWQKPGEQALNILKTSATVSGVALTWKFSKIEESWECIVYIDTQKLSCCTNVNKKVARKEAATIALDTLQKHCYTIKVKQDLDTMSDVIITSEEIKSQESIPDDEWKGSNCIGKKLMKMMGWTGGGLGKSGQGIVEPMSAMVKTQISREGLGSLKTVKTNSCKANEIKDKCRRLFKDLLQTDNYQRNDIVFLDFSKEDRMLIHQVARTMGLKSRSHGKDQRKLIVSRKINIWNLIRELNNHGGITEKYELVKPTDEKLISEAASSKVEGCAAEAPTVTEGFVLDASNHISNTASHISNTANHISNMANHIDRSLNKRHPKKNKKLNVKKKSFPNVAKESVSNAISYNYQSCENPDIQERPSKILKTEEDISFKDQAHSYRDIVLWKKPGELALSTLKASATVSDVALTCKLSKIEEGWKCIVRLDSQQLSCSTNFRKKVARKQAATIALDILQKHCYMIKDKQDLDAMSDITVTSEEIKSQKFIPDDEMMDWTGGDLGKSEQGIVEPMSAMVQTQINRGLGSLETLKTNSCEAHEVRAKCRRLLKDLLQTDDYLRNDILFLDFPREDRMSIHKLARTMGLKSRSHGKRKLIVSRKINIRNLIRELNNHGGVTKKYELVKPTDEKLISPTFTDV